MAVEAFEAAIYTAPGEEWPISSFNAQPEAPACLGTATQRAGASGWALNESLLTGSGIQAATTLQSRETRSKANSGVGEIRLTSNSTTWKGWLGKCCALLAFAAIPAVVCQFLAKPPQDRHIHVEAFRYGKEPSVIRCNRGDRLHLTFSTRDTGHSFFLEEFDVDAKITPGNRHVEVFRTSEPTARPQVLPEVVIQAEHSGWRRYLVSKSQYRCHVWCGPMHAFEHGNLIIAPNLLLCAGLGLLIGIPIVALVGLLRDLRKESYVPTPVLPTDGTDVFRRWPWLKRLMKRRGFQYAWLPGAAAVLYLIVLTTLFGTKMAGRNFGVMMTWVVWLFLLTAVLTPLGGRIWCLVCPLPMFGEMLQRRAITGVRTGATRSTNNRFFGWNRSWPRWLANDWPRTVAFLVLGTFSTALVAVPRFSGWVILCLIVLTLVMALIWELRAFCRYLCPVTAFVGLYSKCGRLALRAADPSVCERCTPRSCLNGSAKGWACPFGLCVADINENDDCGLCTECVKTCPYDNTTLRWRPFAHETAIRSSGQAWMAMSMLVLAVAYCVTHLGHWPALRDWVNVFDKENWGQFVSYAAILWLTALIGVPGVMLALAAAGKRLAGLSQTAWSVMIACSGSLVPMGLMLWTAFVVPMGMVNLSFVKQSLSDPFGWGWDLFGTSNTPWHQLCPSAVPWIQVICVLVGLGYSLRNAWRIWFELTHRPHAALRGTLPMATFLLAIAGYFVWFFAN